MTGQDQQLPGGRQEPPGVPRWVKVIGIVVAALIVLFLIAQVTRIAGDHGPSRHLPGGQGAAIPPGSPGTGDR